MPKFKVVGVATLLLIIGMIGIVRWRVTAQEINLLPETPVSGELDGDKVERWTFEGHRNDVFEFTITPTDSLIPRFTIFDQDNTLHAQLDGNNNGEVTRIVFRITEFGQYTVELQATSATSGGYSLTMRQLETGLRDFDQGRLDYGQTVAQRISDQVPYHIWTFNGRAGQAVDIRMTTTDGDLLPRLTLLSPGDDILGTDVGTAEGQEAHLLAVRLPGDGIYRIRARRDGETLGFEGRTSGSYTLELTLRNGQDATANALALNETVVGRLTLNSPLVRYTIPQFGVFAVEVEFSEPACLVDISLINEGLVLVSRYTGISPFVYPLEVPRMPVPMLEISAADCARPERIDFTLRLNTLNVDLPISRMPDQQTVHSLGQREVERWFFEGTTGDIITLGIQHDTLRTNSSVRLISPKNSQIYRESFTKGIQQTLTLEETGLYILEVLPRGEAYTLQRKIIGKNSVPFAARTPVWEEILDIDTPQVWQFKVTTDEEAVLLIEDPRGQQLITAFSGALGGPRLDAVPFVENGRYRIKIYSATAPRDIRFSQVFGLQLRVDTSVKSSLNNTLSTNLWALPVKAGERVDLILDVLTTGARLPVVSVIDQTGLRVEPEIRRNSGNQLELIGFLSETDQLYRILVTSDGQNGKIDYRLGAVAPLRGSQNAEDLSLQAEPPVGFLLPPTRTTTRYFAPPAPPSILTDAPRLNTDSSVRAELATDELHRAWALDIVRGQLFSAEVVNLDPNAIVGMSLLNDEGEIIAETWEHTQEYLQLTYRTLAAGRYYLILTGSPQGGRFLLDTQTIPGMNERIPEVLDSLPLQVGDVTRGDFEQRSESDHYSFWGIRGQQVHISAWLNSGNLAPSLQVIDSRGRTLAEASYDEEIALAQIASLQLQEDALYHVLVSSTPQGGDPLFSRYDLLVTTLSANIVRGGVIHTEQFGTLGNNIGDNIWFFRAETGESIQLDAEPLDNNGPSPIRLTLEDSTGTPFATQTTALTVNAVRLSATALPRSGIYRVRVSGGGQASGAYRLTLQRDQRYIQTTQHSISYGQSRGGVILPEKPIDRWMFTGNQGDVISIAVRPTWGDALPLGFQLENAMGEILRIGTPRTDSGARNDGILLNKTDIYYVTVGAATTLLEEKTSYALSIERQNQTAARSDGWLINYDTPYEGTIYADDLLDIWQFDGNAGEVLSITVTGDGVFHPSFALVPFGAAVIEGQPQALLSRAGTALDPAQLLQFTLPQTGSYALLIRSANDTTGHYSVLISKNELASQNIRLLEAAQTLEDSITEGETRLWQFDGITGDTVAFTLTTTRRSRLVPNLFLVAPDGSTLLYEDRFDNNQLTTSPYKLPLDGTYTLHVQPAPVQNTNLSGNYSLSFAQTPQNQTEESRSIVYGASVIGNLSRDNTVDLWNFEGQEGDVVYLAGRATSDDLDTVLTLLSPDGAVIAQSDDAPDSLDADLFMVLPQAGQYQVRIEPYGGALSTTAGNYSLELSLEFRPALARIPDDRTLNYGERIVDTLELSRSAPELIDWYFFGRAGDRVDIGLQFPTNDRLLRLFLEDGSGTRFQQGQRIQDRVVIQDFALPADGVYKIVIQRSLEPSTIAYQPYTLGLQLRNTAGEPAFSGGFLNKGISQGGAFNSEKAHIWLYNGASGESVGVALIKLTGGSTPTLMVFSPDNRLLVNQPGGTLSDIENLVLTLPADGFYQIAVVNDLGDPFLSYRLIVKGEQTEIINGRLQPAVTDYGTLSAATNESIWLFDGTTGTPVTARARVASGNLDIMLRLETADGIPLATSIADRATGQVVLPKVALPSDGEYRLIVTRAGTESQTGSYSIQLNEESTIAATLDAIPLPPGIPHNGAIVSANTPVYYSFFGARNAPLSLAAEADGQLLQLAVLSAQGAIITRTDGTLEDFYVSESGYYLVEVASQTPASFTIRYTIRDNQADTPISTLRRSVNLPGSLSPTAPVNLWAVEATVGETLLFEVTDFDRTRRTDLVLFSPTGIPVVADVEAEDESMMVLGPVFIGQTGLYTLRVGRWLGMTNNAPDNYVIRAVVAPEDQRPGSFGGHISIQGQEVRGGLSADDPSDQWTFEGRAGELANLTLRNRFGGSPLSLEVRSPAGETLDHAPYVTGSASTIQIAGLPLTENGTYAITVVLVPSEEVETNAYSLVVNTDAPAILTDVLAQAQALTIGQPVRGELSDKVSVQAWVFFGRAGSSISLNAQTGGAATLQITLTDTTGKPLAGGVNGVINSTLLLEDGFYGVVVNAAQPYTGSYELSVSETIPLSVWRWELALGASERASLSPAAPLHEWELQDYYSAGGYKITVRPTSPHWQARIFVVDSAQQIISSGTLEADGASVLTAYLSDAPDQVYHLLVTTDGKGVLGTYDVAFNVIQNEQTPQPILPETTVSGRITPQNTADEWLWQANPDNLFSLEAQRLEGDFALSVNIYAPGNLFLQKLEADEAGRIFAENILLPVEGTYIIQVTRTGDTLSTESGLYELRLFERGDAP